MALEITYTNKNQDPKRKPETVRLSTLKIT